jgi:hypothetical protein
MRTRFVFALVGVFGCTSASGEKSEPVTPTPPQVEPELEPEGAPDPDPEPEPEPRGAPIVVEMIAATLADDCGGGPNMAPQAVPTKRDEAQGPAKSKAKQAKSKRRCEQSSMQLAITAPADAKSTAVAVKSVELFLASGASLGKLEARAPSVWSDADGYTAWDQRVDAGEDLSVTYALTQPDWTQVKDRWNETYKVEAVLSIDGEEETVQHSVTVAAPTSLPPGVKT